MRFLRKKIPIFLLQEGREEEEKEKRKRTEEDEEEGEREGSLSLSLTRCLTYLPETCLTYLTYLRKQTKQKDSDKDKNI